MDSQLQQKLLKKYNYFLSYIKNVGKIENFLLSKQDIEQRTNVEPLWVDYFGEKLWKTRDKRVYHEKIEPYCKFDEERMINLYYNTYVYTMVIIIGAVLQGEKLDYGEKYDIAVEQFEYLKIMEETFITRIETDNLIFSDYIEWDYYKCMSCTKTTKRTINIRTGEQGDIPYYAPKENPTIQEMLEWMDIADSILQRKRMISIEADKEHKEWVENSIKEREKAKKIKDEAKRQEEAENEEEQKKKEFEYNRQLKLGNRILLLFFTVLTAFVSYLAVGDGRMQEETFQNIRNLAVIIAIPLMIGIYYYSYRYKYIPATNNSIEDKIADIESSIKSKYSRKDKLKIFGIGLFLIITIVFDYTNLFYILVALIFVYGIYQAYKTAKNMDTDKILFEEDVNIKDRIKKSMGGYIDIPYYGYKKVSDNVVDEVYHFFKDKKTEVEVSLTKIKEFELPYDSMDTESLIIMTERYKEYEQQEKDGFAELQKIKAYGTVLERVLKEG